MTEQRARGARIDWAPVQHDVETTRDSLNAIACRHGLAKGTVTQQVARKGWLRPWETTAKRKSAEAAADPAEAMAAWAAKMAKSLDAAASLEALIQRRIKEQESPERLLALHERRLAAMERSVRAATQFGKFLDRRPPANAENDSEWPGLVTDLERQLFARAGIGGGNPPDA
jgi:hypothetical protein